MKFNISQVDPRLMSGLQELAPTLRLLLEPNGKLLIAEKTDKNTLSVTIEDEICHIKYHSTPAFYKAIAICAAHYGETKFSFVSEVKFEDMCAMIDCSRNAVLSVDGAKNLLRRLALFGFNSVMLYTEDTLEIEGYPYFGYMRGRYTQREIHEIQTYAALFGIEIIPCIQTLAHLNQALRWPAFKEVLDMNDILLAGEEKTYELIEAIIKSCRKMFSSNILHIGMDEAHMVGMGNYFKKHGLQKRFDIMNNHLLRVCGICAKYNFSPMIWSDMYVRLVFGKKRQADPEMLDRLPKDVALVCWCPATR